MLNKFLQAVGLVELSPMELKQVRVSETQQYLVAKRNLSPRTPESFRPRSSASYYSKY